MQGTITVISLTGQWDAAWLHLASSLALLCRSLTRTANYFCKCIFFCQKFLPQKMNCFSELEIDAYHAIRLQTSIVNSLLTLSLFHSGLTLSLSPGKDFIHAEQQNHLSMGSQLNCTLNSSGRHFVSKKRRARKIWNANCNTLTWTLSFYHSIIYFEGIIVFQWTGTVMALAG